LFLKIRRGSAGTQASDNLAFLKIHGQRGPTARRHEDSELPARPGWQPEPGLRPLHHTLTLWELQPPIAKWPLTHPQDIDAPLHAAAQRKMNSYKQKYADNQNIPFFPAILSTSTRESLETPNSLSSPTPPPFVPVFCPSLPGRGHPELSLQKFRQTPKRVFQDNYIVHGSTKRSSTRLAAAKAAALRIDLNILGCSVVAPPMHAPSRAPLPLPLLLSHNLPFSRVH
jgi:hypothetical protein